MRSLNLTAWISRARTPSYVNWSCRSPALCTAAARACTRLCALMRAAMRNTAHASIISTRSVQKTDWTSISRTAILHGFRVCPAWCAGSTSSFWSIRTSAKARLKNGATGLRASTTICRTKKTFQHTLTTCRRLRRRLLKACCGRGIRCSWRAPVRRANRICSSSCAAASQRGSRGFRFPARRDACYT